jgi:hypothetical protein
MEQGSSTLNASVQVLSLNRGLHLVSVTSAAPQRVGDSGELFLPAIHVGPGPGVPGDQVEIIPGPRNNGPWLFEAGDLLLVKVASLQAAVLFTTVRGGPQPAIFIEVERLDRRGVLAATPRLAAPIASTQANALAPVAAPPASPPLKTAQGQTAVSVRIDLHIANKGDVSYVNNFWAGALGERLAIEAFAITPLEGPRPDQIEYIATTEAGGETGWVPGGALCGARGRATALTGFAIRVKPGEALAYGAEYRGSFSSGRIVGPLRDGAPCRSEPGDRLEAIQLFILPRTSGGQSPGGPRPADGPALRQETPPARQIGPRFSVFRETQE